MHALKTLVAITAASLATTACAAGGANFSSQLGRAPMANGTQLVQADNNVGSPRNSPATLRVSNYNWLDVNVYAVQGTTRMRLGTVTSMSNGTFQIPAHFLQTSNSVKLLVDPIGSTEGYITDGILVHGGQQINFNVQNALQFSSVAVASR
jgi:hypothetical protein